MDTIEEIKKLVALKAEGAITQEEFDLLKKKIIGGQTTISVNETKISDISQLSKKSQTWLFKTIFTIIVLGIVAMVYFVVAKNKDLIKQQTTAILNRLPNESLKPIQPSMKTLLDFNLRDISKIKDVLGGPYKDEGDVVEWKFKDFVIIYQASEPVLIVIFTFKNHQNYYAELNKYLYFDPVNTIHRYDSKIICSYTDQIQIEYFSSWNERLRRNLKHH